ncbi:SDR family NAD(P)-dependent oxidoreductase [Vibrio sp. Makdt]|uniref:SDR family NAD(P)-dependent oxidoreductase n=1 Tax=Vibrio sp. Makdt TaxID=2998828 RepID=UPI0022CD6544|nr:SDR family oxidoreductase [Vibrio sp. Makdt]MDA0155197.1 SDR family NAD(P)-dependent oxidoreductase [Vibrio sp. Makdt]
MKNIIVTGGSGSIGSAIVKSLIRSGHNVGYTYLNNEGEKEEIWKLADHNNVKVCMYKLDIKNETEVSKFVEEYTEQFGDIDVLINNAGVSTSSLIFSLDSDSLDYVIDTNVKGTILLTKYVSKKMMRRKAGLIINTSSMAGVRGGSGVSAYAASKGAINSFTKSMAIELSKWNIRCIAIAPGYVNSDMISDLKDVHKEELKDRILMGRFGEPYEVAEMVEFFIEKGQFSNGSIYEIDGGM